VSLDQITFTRFVAALTVVFFHYGQTIFPANITFLFENVTAGPIAVGYFYVLSGFIMSIAYYRPEHENNPQNASFKHWKYWMARFARIYPVYLLALLIIVAAKYKSLPDNISAFGLHLSMLQAWIPGYPITLNTPGWSLSVEAFFYLCFPFLLIYVYKSGIKKLIIITAVLWLVTQLILMLSINSAAYAPKNHLHDFIYYNPMMHLNSFVAGMLTGILFKKSSQRINPTSNLLVVGSFALIFILIWARPYIETITGLKIAYTNGLLAPAFLLFIIILASSKGVISNILKHKWLILLGEASYSLYILQKPIHGLYDKIITPRVPLSETTHFYIFLILLILISIASFKYFETPMRYYIRKKFDN